MAILACLTTVTTFVSGQETKKYELRGRCPEGRYEMQNITAMNMTVNVMGQDMPSVQEMNQYVEITAGPVEADGTQKIVTEFKRIAMKQKTGPMEMNFDSDDKATATNSPFKTLGMMVGLKITATFDKDGNVQKTEGWDEFWNKMTENAANEQEKRVYTTMKDTMGADMMTALLGSAKDAEPKQALAVGEKWNIETDMPIPMLGKVNTVGEGVLKAVETVDGVEIAETEMTLTQKSERGQTIEMEPIKMLFEKMDIKSTGVTKMEVTTGLMVSSVVNTEMDMTMIMGGTQKTEATEDSEENAALKFAAEMPEMRMTVKGTGTMTSTTKRL